MKQFDIEKAKAGEKVVDEQGREVTILDYNFKDSGDRPIVGKYKDIGGFDSIRLYKPEWLFMAPVKKKGFLVIWEGNGIAKACVSNIYENENALKDRVIGWETGVITPIEWEE